MRLLRLEITTREQLTIECETYEDAVARASALAEQRNAGHHHGEKTTIAIVDPNAKKEARYFGCLIEGDRRHAGHHLYGERRESLNYYDHGMPWKHLDGELLINAKERDEVTGRVVSTIGKVGERWWWAFVWWDRNGDSRGGSNSGLYVSGFGPNERDAAFAYACEKWGVLIERQAKPLMLV